MFVKQIHCLNFRKLISWRSMFRFERFIQYFSVRNAFSILLVIIIGHLVAMGYYIHDNRLVRRRARREEVIQKIVNVVNLIYATPVEDRKQAIAALTDPYIKATITASPKEMLKLKIVSYWKISQALRRQQESFSVSIELTKNQWLNIHATIIERTLLTLLIFLGVEIIVFSMILLVFWSFNRFSRPLQKFTRMAERLGIDPNSRPLPVGGPIVVREAAAALNKMQKRIRELISSRTQMLAAISHDLRTPITRMKLRAQFLEDIDVKRNLIADLDEMEVMINETLAFARDDGPVEVKKNIDIVSLLRAIADDMSDLGYPVSFRSRIQRVAFLGKPLALKRAFMNLINNAIRYAKSVNIFLQIRHKHIIVKIQDDGPGIPQSELEKVFDPFYRGEQSRNRGTGGVGLGLAVTQEIITTHEGKIYLRNAVKGGLVVVVELPMLQLLASQEV